MRLIHFGFAIILIGTFVACSDNRHALEQAEAARRNAEGRAAAAERLLAERQVAEKSAEDKRMAEKKAAEEATKRESSVNLEKALRSTCSVMRRLLDNVERDKKRWGKVNNEETFMELKQVDISACPPEFQAAFQKYAYCYAKAADFFNDYQGIEGTLSNIGEHWLKLAGGVDSTGDKRLNALQAESMDAVRDVETICLKYGVPVEQIYRESKARLLRAL